MKEIMFVTATEKSNEVNLDCDLFYDKIKDKAKIIKIYNNKVGLSRLYNQFINPENIDKYIVFMHDDAYCEDIFWKEKIEAFMEVFDAFGLAGTTGPIDLTKPSAWHLMSPREGMRGAVAHSSNDKKWMTSFGLSQERVLMFDGVFMAINVEKILKANVKFDEQFTFHHYDLDFCLTCNQNHLRLGVVPIWITHKGLGDSMLNDLWLKSSELFVKKWSS